MRQLLLLFIPVIGTTLGASLVFFLKDRLPEEPERFLYGFAASVMIAASVWSLLIPAIEMSLERSMPGWVPAVVGFWMGIAGMLLIDCLAARFSRRAAALSEEGSAPAGGHMSGHLSIPGRLHMSGHLHMSGRLSRRVRMLVLAVTLHNLPEGMAVGVACEGALLGEGALTFAGVLALSIGISVQNIPEGAIISMPLRSAGYSRRFSFLIGALSGLIEPAGGAVIIALIGLLAPLLPYFLSFAAGAMLYVVWEELVPEAVCKTGIHIGTLGAAAGFTIMMLLDVALG